ncbi:MAG: ABC transporter substrate-binding protein [Methanococcoides sp.]|jgi:iron complex transport system substrate-binding protein|uniref:Cobalamin-binding protein n=1 Tax=Methanococcoides seepicolus TaxID=2828780 RepID=A0A9E4ZJP2_9EURY|nr:cobalamin-binding protein [Methanococcoides seepicolus]MCM1987908.1 cobalamin-binding protein [Methanococcoides seepicolus]NOQ48728.1 ABC transporter substrate-binding protein [Methanococcoides sp.]
MLKRTPIILLISILLLISNVQASDNNTVEYPITITDSSGATITIEKEPGRIVSLMPSITEILFTVGAGDKMVGGTEDDKYPPEAINLTKVGRYTTINYETVVQLEPDLVILDEANGEDTIIRLEDLNIQTVMINPKTMDEIIESILLVGTITNNEDNAQEIVDGMRQTISDITDSTKGIPDEERPRVLYIVWDDPIYSAGKDTYPSDLITMAGGQNIIEANGWPTINLENIVSADPQIIICSGMGGLSYQIANNTRNNDALETVAAIKNDRVYPIKDPNIIELSGPRIVQGLEVLHLYMGDDWEQKDYTSLTDASQPHVDAADEGPEEEGLVQDGGNATANAPGFGVLLAISMMVLGYMGSRRY